MTQKDRVINAAIDRIMGCVVGGFKTIQDLEAAVTALYDEGYQQGYDDGFDDGHDEGYSNGSNDTRIQYSGRP